MPERLDAVLTAVYAAFAGGWQDATLRNLAEEALWLGRLVTVLLPEEPEALGLLALMLHAEARRAARRDAAGAYVPLDQQDTALWDAHMIEEAETLLLRASAAGVIGRYQLEAAVQSAHAARRLTGPSTGRRSSGSTMRCRRSPTHLWWRSTAPLRSRRRVGRRRGLHVSRNWPWTGGSRTTSLTGPLEPNCWRAPARRTRPIRPTSVRSAWRLIRQCASTCSVGRRNCEPVHREAWACRARSGSDWEHPQAAG